MFSQFLIFFFYLSAASAVTICSSSSLLSTFTDPLCTSWCKVRFCSSGSCRSVLAGDDPTCQCESCGFGGNWFGSSSDSNSNQPVTGQYYAAGSGGEMTTQNYRNNFDDSRNYGGNGNGQPMYNNGYNNGYNNNYRTTAGYGNANSNFNSNQQYMDYNNYNNNYRGNQYGSNVPSGYGGAGQANYASGYQNLRRK